MSEPVHAGPSTAAVQALSYDSLPASPDSVAGRIICWWGFLWGVAFAWLCTASFLEVQFVPGSTFLSGRLNLAGQGMNLLGVGIGLVIVLLAMRLRRPTRGVCRATVAMAGFYLLYSLTCWMFEGPLYYADRQMPIDQSAIIQMVRAVGIRGCWAIGPLMLAHYALTRLKQWS